MKSVGIVASKKHLRNRPGQYLYGKIVLTCERILQPVVVLMGLIMGSAFVSSATYM